jgi:hypothetical protein
MPEITDQQILDYINQVRSQGGDENVAIKKIADAAKANGVSLQRIADITDYNEDDIRGFIGQAQNAGQRINVPGDLGFTPSNASLPGAESALRASLGAAKTAIDTNFSQSRERLQPYAQTGTQANDALAALQGLLGPDAQAKAFSDFKSSPGQDFLVEQGEKALTRNASALGGIGGGNVRRELMRQGQGFAQQDFGNFRDSLERTRSGGQAASTGIANSYQTQGLTEADLQTGLGGAIATGRLNQANRISDQNFQAGILDAQFRQQNNNNAANYMGNASSDLQSLISGMGRNTADLGLSLGGDLQRLRELGILTIPGMNADAGKATAAGKLGTADAIRGTVAGIGSAIGTGGIFK